MKGKDVVVGIVVEADNGMVIDIEVLEDETSQTIKSWLIPILKEVKAEVIVTDDADSFKEVADSLEVHHQVCLRHIENITEFVEKMRVSNTNCLDICHKRSYHIANLSTKEVGHARQEDEYPMGARRSNPEGVVYK